MIVSFSKYNHHIALGHIRAKIYGTSGPVIVIPVYNNTTIIIKVMFGQ